MHRPQGAAEDRHDLLVAVERHVEREVHASVGIDQRTDAVVDGVPLDDTPSGAIAADAGRVVQRQHRLQAGQARRHHLRSTTEPGEEVGLDEAGGDAHVGRQPGPVQQHRHVAVVPTQPFELLIVAGIVVDHPDDVDDVTEHGPELGRRAPTMGSRGDQHRHVLRTDDSLELLQDGRDHEVSRLGSGAVAHRDGNGLTGPHQVAQRRARHGPAQGAAQRRGRISEGRLVGRLHHGQVDTGRQLDRKPAVPVGQTHLHRAHPVRLPARSDSARASDPASRRTRPAHRRARVARVG